MAKSPSITILERDMSTYTVTNSSTILAVVGYATKGPIGKATKIYSYQEFLSAFGTAPEDSPYSTLAVKRAFNQGNQMIYLRVADDTASVAGVLVAETTQGTAAKQSFNKTGDFTVPTAGTYTLKVSINGGSPIVVNIVTSGTTVSAATVASAISQAINPSGSANSVGGVVVVSTAVIGAAGSVEITDGDTDGFLAATSVTVNAMVPGVDTGITNSDKILFVSKEKGSSCNKIQVQKTSRLNPITFATIHKIEIFYDGNSVEVFDNVSLNVNDPNFFATKINADEDNGGSKWVTVYTQDKDSSGNVNFPDNNPEMYYSFGKGITKGVFNPSAPFETTFDYLVGTDGIPTSSASASALFVEALSTDGDLGNMDEYDFHILITPDAPIVQVQEAALALAGFRKDFLYLVDPPFGFSASNVQEWHNGQGHGRSSALNTSFGALYWPWLKDYNSFSNEYVWCPPSVFMAEKLMEVDVNYGPWAAPAGDSRGKLNASDYETSPSLPVRERIYGDLNAVNPFVYFSSKGLEIYGQKTLLRENSSLNRVNVRRMIIYASKLIKKAMEAYLFEPHIPDTWKRASAAITNILEPIKQAGGIDQYKVVIDGTTNTADVISQNIMKGIIKIIPTNTVEIIELTLQVHKAGATLE